MEGVKNHTTNIGLERALESIERPFKAVHAG